MTPRRYWVTTDKWSPRLAKKIFLSLSQESQEFSPLLQIVFLLQLKTPLPFSFWSPSSTSRKSRTHSCTEGATKKKTQWRFLSLSQYYRTINTDNLPPNFAGMNMPYCYRRWFGEFEVDKKAAEPWLSCRLHKFNSLVLSFGETLAKPKGTFCPKFALVVY